ncbi:MAG: terminase gpA endonuclease subunit [Beijerinckiaceae bacterium]
MRPTKETTPDEWGARNRVYPPSAGVPGPRDPFLTPYAVPFGRAVGSRLYRRGVMCISAQSGKTDTLLDIIGQRLDQRPVPILYVGPNQQYLREQFNPRLMDLIDEAPALAGKVARGKRMTKTRKMIAGVPLRLAHAGSSTALKSDPAGLAITDEADELMRNVKGQGDPVGLVDARGDTYEDFVHAMVSTPSRGLKETEIDPVSGLEFWKAQAPEDIDSTIWKFWQAGTRYHWTWRCPHCGERFVPRFSCLEYEGKGRELETSAHAARETAMVACPRNGCLICDERKPEMNASGAYAAPGQAIGPDGEIIGDPPSSDTASFWVSGLASPFRSFGDRAAAYVEAVQSGDQEKVQTVINAGFGELWAPTAGEAPEWAEVAELKLPYRFREVPDGVLFLTAGVDVQGNRLVYVVRGWGVRQESWLIEHGELFGSGDTRLDDVWIDLWTQVLDGEYGEGLRIARAFIDSGFRPDKPNEGFVHKVYDFCRRHARVCYATKGFERRATPISVNRIDVTPSGGRSKFGLDLVRLDTDYLKSWVHSRVRWPKDQPGGWHLPLDADENYCRQIVNEARVRKPSGGYTWVPRGPRDYLDAEAMAYGAAKMIGLDRVSDHAQRRPSPSPKPPRIVEEDMPPPSPAPPPVARSARSRRNWLGGRRNDWLNAR